MERKWLKMWGAVGVYCQSSGTLWHSGSLETTARNKSSTTEIQTWHTTWVRAYTHSPRKNMVYIDLLRACIQPPNPDEKVTSKWLIGILDPPYTKCLNTMLEKALSLSTTYVSWLCAYIILDKQLNIWTRNPNPFITHTHLHTYLYTMCTQAHKCM